MHNVKPLVSVIVPIYNVEKYLEKCIDSLIKQTYKVIEIILVNDGSNDKCKDICDRYKNMDNRIKVIHKKNRGVSSARNSGLDISSGEYILFVDGDDYVHNTIIEDLVKTAINNDADIVHFNFQTVNENGNIIKIKNKDFDNGEILNAHETLAGYIKDYKIKVMPWNKLYKRELFEGLRFDEGYVYEDELIFPKIINRTDRNVMLNKKLYFYTQRSNSITKSNINKNKIESKKRLIEFLEKFYLEKYPNLIYYVYVANCFHCLGIIKGIKNSTIYNKKDEIEYFKNLYLYFYSQLNKCKIYKNINLKKEIYLYFNNILFKLRS